MQFVFVLPRWNVLRAGRRRAARIPVADAAVDLFEIADKEHPRVPHIANDCEDHRRYQQVNADDMTVNQDRDGGRRSDARKCLPGVGPSLAQRIVAFRDLNGPFVSSDELLDVGGMTPGKVEALSPKVTFH